MEQKQSLCYFIPFQDRIPTWLLAPVPSMGFADKQVSWLKVFDMEVPDIRIF